MPNDQPQTTLAEARAMADRNEPLPEQFYIDRDGEVQFKPGRAETTVTCDMLEDGYEALRERLPIDLRPPHGPISVDDLMCMAEACYRVMEAARAKAT